MALAQTDLPELRRFTFFVSRRFEEGRERFRLHMGYFATLAEAEEWLNLVREIYPGAWAGEAPGRKLRERAAAAAAAQARHAAGPQVQASAPATRAASLAPAPQPPPAAMRVPVVHAAPPLAPRAVAAGPMQPAVRPGMPAATPAAARVSARLAPPVAHPAPPTAAVASAAAAARPRIAPAAPQVPARAVPSVVGRAQVKQVFEDSNVREVLKALGDASPTGETRQMPAPPPPRETTAEHSGLSDTQVLKLLETRRSEDSEALPAEIGDGSAIPLLKPDDTGTRRALKEAVASNAPVSFAVQLQWSVQQVELERVPPLAIFSAFTLYTVEGSRDGRKWYGLRLGFFSDAISAKQVAHYVRSEFASVAVVPVSPQEKARATDQEIAATLAAPAPARADQDEFKLIDENAAPPAPQVPAGSAPRPAPKAAAKPAAARPVRAAPAPGKGRARSGKVGARERRGPQTLEETLEILGADKLSIDTGSGEILNDSGVRHLHVEVQKNSPFSKLLERLSERLKRP